MSELKENNYQSVEECIEKWYFFPAIQKLKSNLWLNVITEEQVENYSTLILSCIDSISKHVSNFHRTISELENIIDDESIFDKLSPLEKSKYFIKLWEQFYKSWEINECLKFYNKAFELWNEDIYETIVDLEIIYSMLFYYNNWNDEDNLSVDYDNMHWYFINKISELRRENSTSYSRVLANDLEHLLSWIDVHKWELTTIEDCIYDLETKELKVTNLIKKWENEEIINLLSYRLGDLEDSLEDALWKFWENSLVWVFALGSEKRVNWAKIKFIEYWKYIEEFIRIVFELIVTFNYYGEYDKSLFLLDTISAFWFRNLRSEEKDMIINHLLELLEKGLDNDYKKELSDIIYRNMNWHVFSNIYTSADLLVNLWYYSDVLELYIDMIKDESLLREKLAELLEEYFDKTGEIKVEVEKVYFKIKSWEHKNTDLAILRNNIKSVL